MTTSYIVRCDVTGCASVVELMGMTRDEVLAVTSAAGWQHPADDRAMCPDCAQGFIPEREPELPDALNHHKR